MMTAVTHAEQSRTTHSAGGVRFSDRLTPFEYYMLADDTVQHPMNFFLRLTFEGELELPRLRVAWETVRNSHPLLMSTVELRRFGRPRWRMHGGDVLSHFDRRPGDSLPHGQMPRIDLTGQPGPRTWCAANGGKTEMWFQFHHSCCDAIAAVGILTELFDVYRSGGIPYVSPVSATAANSVQARRRRDFGRRSPKGPRRLGRQLQRTIKFVRSKPRPLPRWRRVENEPPCFPAFITHTFPENQQFRRPICGDGTPRATINDWLLAALFSAVGDWFRRCGEANEHVCVRIAVPLNLRSSADEYRQCVNCVSMVFLDRPLAATKSAGELLPSISHEMSQVKAERLGDTLLTLLSFLAACPAAMQRVLARRACASTTVLSNLGVIFASGRDTASPTSVRLENAVLESVDFLPPIRRGVAAAFGVLTYAGRLSCCMHYDPLHLARSDATDLFQSMLAKIDEPAGSTR